VKDVPQHAQFLSVGKVGKRPTDERHLLPEVGAAVANQQMQTQRQALGWPEAAIEALGHEAGGLFAGEQHLTPYGSNWLRSPYNRLSGV
jgi:hypothetical protein